MNAKQEKGEGDTAPRAAEASARTPGKTASDSSQKAGERPVVGRRPGQYLVTPRDGGQSAETLARQLREVGGGAEVVRLFTPQRVPASPVAVVRMTAGQADACRQAMRGSWLIEADEMLHPLNQVLPRVTLSSAATAIGSGFTATVQVVGENDEQLERAIVQLVGQNGSAEGETGADGRVGLTLFGESPDTVTALVVKPRLGYWNFCKVDPQVQASGTNLVRLTRIDLKQPAWGGEAMGFDQLPAEFRGRDVKIALIDSGVATGHKQLTKISHGGDGGGGQGWDHDPTGHGTASAGIIAAAEGTGTTVRGFAPDAELHVYKLPVAAHCSDLLDAFDYCIEQGIDIACLGLGCAYGSAIVANHIALARQQGVATIAAAGNGGGDVLFPARLPHVTAVGAVGRFGSFPAEDSLAAAYASPDDGSGLFAAAFSCRGAEIDLAAPGIAVVCCQPPDGYAVLDGTSLAASHIAAAGALILAHHPEFQRGFAARDARRVERLFQILQQNARLIGNPMRTGSGMPDMPRALGLRHPQATVGPPSVQAELDQLRLALRQAGLEDERSAAALTVAMRETSFADRLPFNGGGGPPSLTGGRSEAWLRDLRSAMAHAGLAALH